MKEVKLKKLKKLNILDVVLLIVVIGMALTAYIKVNKRELEMITSKSETTYIEIRVAADDNPDLSEVTAGNILSEKERGVLLGVVGNIDIEYQKEFSVDDEGNEVASVSDKIVAMNIKVKATTKSDETGSYIDSEYLVAPGKMLEFTIDGKSYYKGKIHSLAKG